MGREGRISRAGVRLKLRYGSGGTLSALVCGGIVLAVSFGVRIATGSPYAVLYRLRSLSLIPPVFLTTVLFSVWFLLLGGVFGLCVGSASRGCDVEKYKGGMLLLPLILFELIWYPCFLVRTELFFSLLLLLVCVLLTVGTLWCFRKISVLSAVLLGLHALWLLYLVIINLLALFRF